MSGSPPSQTTPVPVALTVGRYRPRGAFAAAGDAIGPPDGDGSRVRIVALGGPLPIWAEPDAGPPGSGGVEIVLLPDEAAPQATWPGLRRCQPTEPALRVLVRSEAYAVGPAPRDGRCATLDVTASPGDRDTVALVLAACAHGGGLLIGTDAGDLRRVAGADPGRAVQARGLVIAGLADAGTGAHAHGTITELAAIGYGGGRLMVQLVAGSDAAALSLEALDACAAAAGAGEAGREWILTCAFADRTALALVAFGFAPSCTSTDGPSGVVG